MGTWGVKGHVKVKRFGRSSEIFNPGSIMFHDKGDLIIQNSRATRSQNNDILVVKFESIDNVQEAEALKGLDLKSPNSRLWGLRQLRVPLLNLVGNL